VWVYIYIYIYIYIDCAAIRVGGNKKWDFNTVLSSSLKTDECNLKRLLNVAHTAVVLCCFVTISENDNHSLQAI